MKQKIIPFLSLIMGMIFGVGLLTYSGEELVNVMVFLAIAVFIPLLFSLISLGTILYNFIKKDPLLWQGLKLSNQIGFLFSLGLLLSFLLTIATQDIAFGWSSTLNITSQEIYRFLGYFAIWKEVLPTAFIDENLIDLSHFKRLGSVIAKEQILNAFMLGNWWKFLAMMVLVWGAGVRFFLFQLSLLGIKLTTKSTLKHYSKTTEEDFIPLSNEYKNKINISKLEDKKYQLLPWGVDENSSRMISDTLDIKYSKIHTFSFSKDIEEDDEKLKLLKNIDSIIIVKSWEIPTMDFIDFVDDVATILNSSKVYLLVVGLEKDGYISDKKELNIWLRKLKETHHENIISLN